MTLHECTAALTMLAFELGVEVDDRILKGYHVSLGHITAEVFEVACRNVAHAPRDRFEPRFPPPNRLRTEAEIARRQLLATVPYAGCVECEDSIGWRKTARQDGTPAVEQCPCRARHRHQVGARGLLTAITSLDGEAAELNEQVFPRLEQLPEQIRRRVTTIADRKVLR